MICKIKPVVSGLSEKEKRTVMFAALELQRYLGDADPCGDFPVIAAKELDETDGNALWLVVGHSALPEVPDAYYDDVICIKTKGVCGLIAGSNARSVLIGAYRFLREQGYLFFRPGKHGTKAPEMLTDRTIDVCETPSYRHRTICLNASVTQEDAIAIVDWIPKAAMNGYMIQFRNSTPAFKGYYNLYNHFPLSDEEIASLVDLLRDEMHKRSLLFHGVGHGWTNNTMGIYIDTWEDYNGEVTEEQKSMMAELDGERKLFRNQPFNTNLCLSQAKVRDKMTDIICDYCVEHPEMDYVHVWLADGGNNNCECKDCIGRRPAEDYVKMLNELDVKMEKAGVSNKIVFLMYSGLLWAPLEEKVNNKERFILMFAPYDRTYTHHYDGRETINEMPPYVHNKNAIIKTIGDNQAALRDWQNAFGGECFVFDYYHCGEHIQEMTGYGLAQIVSQDIKHYGDIGLSGLINCQVQRIFLPTALVMNVMADTLWNQETEFETIANRTLSAQFGHEYQLVLDYLANLYENACAKAIRGEDDLSSPENKVKLAKAIEIVKAFRPVIQENIDGAENATLCHNWKALQLHSELAERMLSYYLTDDETVKLEISKEYNRFTREKTNAFKLEFDPLTYVPFGADPMA